MSMSGREYSRYLKKYDKKHGTKGGMTKPMKDKALKNSRKGKVYNTGKGYVLRSGNSCVDAYWNKS